MTKTTSISGKFLVMMQMNEYEVKVSKGRVVDAICTSASVHISTATLMRLQASFDLVPKFHEQMRLA